MIKIYTDKSLCPKPMITFNDKHFNTSVSSEFLDADCRELMKKFDDAEIIDEEKWLIKTRFGTGDIRNLSTGVKTLINAHNMKKERQPGTIDVREIGENLVSPFLQLVNGSEIGLYTGKYNFVGILDENYAFILNDTQEIIGTSELSLKLEKLRCRK